MQRAAVNRVIALACAVLFVAGCSQDVKPKAVSFSGPTMGTEFHVKYFTPETGSSLPLATIQPEVEARLAQINELMSTYRKDSELSQFNAAEPNQWFSVSKETAEVIALALDISARTGGAFDVTVASLVDLWGFGPVYRADQLPAPQAIEAELETVGYQSLKLRQTPPALMKLSRLTVDLSAIAKGYAVDLVAEYLEQAGVTSYMVEVGGEVRAKGLKPGAEPWRIGVESPVAGQRSVGRIIRLTDIAIATSGDYRNYFEVDGKRYSHTIDPLTGYPVTHDLASITVLAKTSTEADALATALNVMGPEKALKFANENAVPALLIVKNKTASGFVELESEAFTDWVN